MTDQMDVDLPTPLLPSASFPASEKRTEHILSQPQLIWVNDQMKIHSYNQAWELRIERAGDSDSLWQGLLADVLTLITNELAVTDMKDSVITSPTVQHARDIVKGFNKDELEQWKAGVRNGVENNDWTLLVTHPKLENPKMPNVAPTPELLHQQERATEDSWQCPYLGQAAEALWVHIQNHYDPKSNNIYAHYAGFVQSSGMGKSRAVDELGKQQFSIPLNLRGANSTGYPPPDDVVRDFLTRNGSQGESYRRACCFFDALFQYTYQILQNLFNSQCSIDEVAFGFRNLMTTGQKMKEHNKFRRGFYNQVVHVAENKLSLQSFRHPVENDSKPGYASPPSSKDPPDYNFAPSASCDKLVKFLNTMKQATPTTSQAPRKTKGNYPLIILAFDEAHTLNEPEATPSPTWSHFSNVRHVLRALYRFPLFSLFLSTTGKISQFTSPEEDESKRIHFRNLTLIQPFTDLGFDTFAKKVSLDGSWDLERVTADEHIVYLGRPLFGSRHAAGDRSVKEDIVMFAAEKLLNADPNTRELTHDQALACLSQRLPIEFNSTTYISQAIQRKQVEGHMRVCLKVDAAFESMETVSASEPLLSEAAYAIMTRQSFNALKSFKSVLEGFAVHKGDRGEFLALLLLTLARDEAVGPPDKDGRPQQHRFFDFASFISRSLFQAESAEALEKLQEDFPDAKMHFNHFIKLHDYKSVNKESLLLLMTRGAGVLCANNYTSIDAVNVFLRSGTKLSIDNLGLILYQIKNDSDYTHNPKPKLFDIMDLYDRGILQAGDAAVPVIRIFFALAARTPCLHVTRHDPSSTYDAVIYDIWCAGLSPEVLNPIKGHTTDIWHGLLQASYGWENTYKAGSDVEKNLRRSMNPGAADDGGHWSRWAIRGHAK